jgi:hypothetical protein
MLAQAVRAQAQVSESAVNSRFSQFGSICARHRRLHDVAQLSSPIAVPQSPRPWEDALSRYQSLNRQVLIHWLCHGDHKYDRLDDSKNIAGTC